MCLLCAAVVVGEPLSNDAISVGTPHPNTVRVGLNGLIDQCAESGRDRNAILHRRSGTHNHHRAPLPRTTSRHLHPYYCDWSLFQEKEQLPKKPPQLCSILSHQLPCRARFHDSLSWLFGDMATRLTAYIERPLLANLMGTSGSIAASQRSLLAGSLAIGHQVPQLERQVGPVGDDHQASHA